MPMQYQCLDEGTNGLTANVHKCIKYIEYTKQPATHSNHPNANRESSENLRHDNAASEGL